MNKAIRWRVVSLQAMLVIILASASGFLFYEGNFVTNMVKDELTAQQVFFPQPTRSRPAARLTRQSSRRRFGTRPATR